MPIERTVMMKLPTHTLAVAVALAAASTLSLAQTRAPRGANDVSTYQRNNQAPTTPRDAGGTALREDLDGTPVTTDHAVQLCSTLSRRAQRDDCVAQVSRDDASMPAASDSGMLPGSTMDRGTSTDGMTRRNRRR
jgi:hypothetical protein